MTKLQRKAEIRRLVLKIHAGAIDRGELPLEPGERSDHVLKYAKSRIRELKQETPGFVASAWTEDKTLVVIRVL